MTNDVVINFRISSSGSKDGAEVFAASTGRSFSFQAIMAGIQAISPNEGVPSHK